MTGARAAVRSKSRVRRADIADVSVFLPTVGQLARVVAGPVNLVAVVERLDGGAVVLDVHGAAPAGRRRATVVQLRLRRRAARRPAARSTRRETRFLPAETGARFAQRRETFRVTVALPATIVRRGRRSVALHDAEPVDRRRAARDRATVRARRPADGRDRLRRRPNREPGGDRRPQRARGDGPRGRLRERRRRRRAQRSARSSPPRSAARSSRAEWHPRADAPFAAQTASTEGRVSRRPPGSLARNRSAARRVSGLGS